VSRKVWVLDTETKGTGAEMVPLEKAREWQQVTHREKQMLWEFRGRR
jgi:hypothetical protein